MGPICALRDVAETSRELPDAPNTALGRTKEEVKACAECRLLKSEKGVISRVSLEKHRNKAPKKKKREQKEKEKQGSCIVEVA